ncbi:hypothetical protein [Dyadobacter fermentans]|uniref:Protein kinase domain-containing protein n=1 Tax=Dyadobacter fermentans (strain ATCC 700827 / DSM 18053 / CIP 107007 / KCTC 52180 / NS114) TaxID=471854 RepID=C6W634_DYAFD|nr:hypothetical protein [Dyadobacter fermentans]ACT92514.1 hypothetical protein Dfer_1265 [Dyadobacter fermentans DSM 18053]
MTEGEMIDQVMHATHFNALKPQDGSVLTYRDILKAIHPDKCRHPGAKEATNRLLTLYRHFNNGAAFTDDSGECLTNDFWVHYRGEEQIVAYARQKQQAIATGATEHLKRYMPYTWNSDTRLVHQKRAIPLVNLTLPQEHVNWVVSRLLEFCMLLHRHAGQAHLGLTPAHIMLVPETHGIAVAGFYHITALGSRATTISAGYRNWYPVSLLRDKIASENADLEMVKRIGAYLLGDRSGLGTALRKTHHRAFVDFLLSSDDDSLACYEKYRALLKNNFPSQFIHLNI